VCPLRARVHRAVAVAYKPVREIAEASETGPATIILACFTIGLALDPGG
jgi:hypothetical protein